MSYPCPWDIAPDSGDNVVNLDDLLALLANWGACPTPPAPCPWDIAGGSSGGPDNAVNLDDLPRPARELGAMPGIRVQPKRKPPARTNLRVHISAGVAHAASRCHSMNPSG